MSTSLEFKPMTKEEIRQLSDDAKRVFAVRCALRILPLLGYQGHFNFWQEKASLRVFAFEVCVLAAATNDTKNSISYVKIAQDALGSAGDIGYYPVAFTVVNTIKVAQASAVAEQAYSMHIALKDDEDAAHTANREYVTWAEEATDAALHSASSAVKAAEYFKCSKEMLFELSSDITKLIEAKDAQALFNTPLWSDEVPKQWEFSYQKWQSAVNNIKAEGIYTRYQGFLMGDPDFNAARHLVDTWFERVGSQESGFGVGGFGTGGFGGSNKQVPNDQSFSESDNGALKGEVSSKKINKGFSAEILTEKKDLSGASQKSETGYFGSDSDLGRPDSAPASVGQKHSSEDDEAIKQSINDLNASEIVKGGAHLGNGKKTNEDSLDKSSSEKKGTSAKQGKEEPSAFTPYAGGPVTASLDDATTVDHLGRTALVNALRGLLDHSEQPGKLTIGLMGHWGAGKSSVIKMLEKALCDKERTRHSFICIEFDAWAYEHCGNIQAGMAQEVVNGLTKGLGKVDKLKLAWELAWKQHPWKMHSALWSLVVFALSSFGLILWGQEWLAGLVGASSVGFGVLLWSQLKKVVAHPMAAQLKSYLRLPDFGEHLGLLPIIRQQVAELCEIRLGEGASGNRLLFIIDNLDRCGVEGLVKVLEATHIVMGLPQVVVMIAVDHRMALAALSQHYSELAEKGSNRTAQAIARDYLGKIFQLSIQLDGSSGNISEYVEQDLFPDVEALEKSSKPEKHEADSNLEDESPASKPEVLDDENNSADLPEKQTGKDQSDEVTAEAPGSEDKIREPEQPRSHIPESNGFEVEQKAMKDTLEEKKRFEALAVELDIHNPRQLKRLHNTYRLMKGIAWHRKRQPPIDEKLLKQWLESMGMLFWLEYLYGLDSAQRKKNGADFTNMRIQRYKKLRSMISEKRGAAFKSEYETLKRDVEPLMLPFTDKDKEVDSQA